jgi:hypothetical protein
VEPEPPCGRDDASGAYGSLSRREHASPRVTMRHTIHRTGGHSPLALPRDIAFIGPAALPAAQHALHRKNKIWALKEELKAAQWLSTRISAATPWNILCPAVSGYPAFQETTVTSPVASAFVTVVRQTRATMRLRRTIPRTFVLCAPFWSGSAHVMTLGPVVVEQPTPQRDGGNSDPVRHRTHPLPDCEAIEKCRWLLVTCEWRLDSRDMAYLGRSRARTLLFRANVLLECVG